MYRKTTIILIALANAHAQSADTQTPQLPPAQVQQQMKQLPQGGTETAPGQAPQSNFSPAQLQQNIQALSAANATASAGAAHQTPAAPVFLVRQASTQIPAASHPRETIFVKTKSNDMADALKTQAMSQAINLGAAAAARNLAGNVPYFGGMTSMAGHLPLGGNGKQQGWEFDFLRGLSAELELKTAPSIAFIVPPLRSIPGAAGIAAEPLIVKLKPVEHDKVRIIAARKVVMGPKTPASAFGGVGQKTVEGEVLSTDYESVAVEVKKNADGSATVTFAQTPPPGEYALVFQRPEPKTLRLIDVAVDFRIVN